MIYWIRHGLDDESFIGGWSNNDLTTEGKRQILEQIDFLKTLKIEKIISSDILRAKTSALLIQEKLKKEFMYTDLLRELNKGKLNGMEKKLAMQKYSQMFENVQINTVYPGGESMERFYERIVNDLIPKLPEWKNCLMVTHRGVINMLYYYFHHQELDMNKERWNVTHASIHELDLQKKRIRRIK